MYMNRYVTPAGILTSSRYRFLMSFNGPAQVEMFSALLYDCPLAAFVFLLRACPSGVLVFPVRKIKFKFLSF